MEQKTHKEAEYLMGVDPVSSSGDSLGHTSNIDTVKTDAVEDSIKQPHTEPEVVTDVSEEFAEELAKRGPGLRILRAQQKRYLKRLNYKRYHKVPSIQ